MISGRREEILQLSVPQRKHRQENPQPMGCVDADSSINDYFFLLHIQPPEYVAQHNSFKLRSMWGSVNMKCFRAEAVDHLGKLSCLE